MIRFLVYAAIACGSYCAGLLAYMVSLFLLYGETPGSESDKLVGWTLPSYLFILLPACTLLHFWKRQAYAIRIGLLLFTSFIAAAAVPAMMGFWFAWLLDPLSPELGLFILQFAATAAMFFVGTAVVRTNRGLLFYLALAVVFTTAAIYMI
jgi:hypothetical protein